MLRNSDYCTLFASVFGFNWRKAADYFGVCERTVHRWYDANSAPVVIIKHLLVMERGYLPLEGCFAHWRIEGDKIRTPYGVVLAADIEFIYQYKWAARQYQRLVRERPGQLQGAEAKLRSALTQAQKMLDELGLDSGISDTG